MHEVWREAVATAAGFFAAGLALGYFGLRRRPRFIRLGDRDPAKRCPTCLGTGRKDTPPLTPIATFNCGECGARSGGHHGAGCSRIPPEKS